MPSHLSVEKEIKTKEIVLKELNNNPSTIPMLFEKVNVSRVTLVHILRRLRKQRYVDFVKEKDQKAKFWFLTNEGREFFKSTLFLT